MKLRKAFLFRKVSVPQLDNLINIEFSSQVATYPAIGKIHKDQVHFLQMLERLHILLFNNCFHFVEHFVHTGLHLSVVVLDVGD